MKKYRVHAFPKGICSKVKIMAQREFEFAYHNVTIQKVSHYAMRTLLQATETNPSRVSGDLGITPSNVIRHHHDFGESTHSCRSVPHITKIFQNF